MNEESDFVLLLVNINTNFASFVGPTSLMYLELVTEDFVSRLFLEICLGLNHSNYKLEIKGATCIQRLLKDPASLHFLSQWEALGLY